MHTLFKNGQAIDSANAVEVAERGLAFGDGVFETFFCHNGEIPLWEYHWQRLQRGLQHLRIHCALEAILDHHQSVLAALGQNTCVIKLMVTRGVGGKGYAAGDSEATLLSLVRPWSPEPPIHSLDKGTGGIHLHLCSERLAEGQSWAELKTLNQLPYVLATLERQGQAYDEGLLLSTSGKLVEATARNLFLVKNGVLITPDLSAKGVASGVAGVMRQYILEVVAPALGYEVRVLELTLDDLLAADEVFVCNSISGVWPVACCRLANDHVKHWSQLSLGWQLRHHIQNTVFN